MIELRHTFYYKDLERWWDTHHRWGGSVYECSLPWKFFPDQKKPMQELFLEFASLDFDSIEKFQSAIVWDNDIENRVVMEDATKIWFLYSCIKSGVGIKFNPQIIHEPWHDRYRVHPGSGRLAAMWLGGINHVKCIYTHFNEPVFEPPPHSQKIHDIEGMVLSMFGNTASRMRADIDTYFAFPKSEHEVSYTQARDSEWEWNHIKTDTPWQFVRYSEGQSFTESKVCWRDSTIDLWYRLNSHDCDLVTLLDL